MSFLKKLFGGGGSSSGPKVLAEASHEGCRIAAAPMPEADGQFRLSGTIEKEIDGAVKTHHLIRADVFPSADAAAEATIAKAKRIIDEQGEGLFR
jgi:hypothetical protein